MDSLSGPTAKEMGEREVAKALVAKRSAVAAKQILAHYEMLRSTTITVPPQILNTVVDLAVPTSKQHSLPY